MYDGDDVVEMIKHYAEQMGYPHDGFRFLGPLFKSSDMYLTNQGYPAGTVIWYVHVEMWYFGRDYIFGGTFEEAAWAAHEKMRELIADENAARTSGASA